MYDEKKIERRIFKFKPTECHIMHVAEGLGKYMHQFIIISRHQIFIKRLVRY